MATRRACDWSDFFPLYGKAERAVFGDWTFVLDQDEPGSGWVLSWRREDADGKANARGCEPIESDERGGPDWDQVTRTVDRVLRGRENRRANAHG